jgi:hypothetical protein
MIEELDRVVLTRDLPGEKLKAGDVGTVVMVLAPDEAFEVEFMTLAGDTLAVTTLQAEDLRPVLPSEVAHARAVA